jgi:alcohol dehydrogenase (cytochrome c)
VRDWIAALDAATGKRVWLKYTVPAPGEPGSETWKDTNNAWQTGGAAVWVTGTYDVETNQTIWGTGNPVPMFDPTYRPGDNLYTNSAISWDPDTGKMNWYFQYTPGDMWDFDEVGTHSSLPIRHATASSTPLRLSVIASLSGCDNIEGGNSCAQHNGHD